ncbi:MULTISPECIES: TonB-dependent siderophore receptor [unclassified Herbaspirillum]|uniref:TonB-dependent receptor family protein n=1 Tax=unclassified Herbaspirillum TaxID=2624150 RepID=UPI0011505DCB|nr:MULTISPECIES: TonB-dependent siderophore receptor [unclassified Herbaspirillum]MBB5390817.1 Fe(3+) dicitrate transport protein [Herbaspirillum sp. SJZ102]
MTSRPQAGRRTRCAAAISLALMSVHGIASSQQAAAGNTDLETIHVSGDWLGSGLENSIKTYPGARTSINKDTIESSGAINVGDILRQIPGVQASDNSGSAGSAIALNIGVRGLTGRYSPRSTILLDGIPLASAPYGQPQQSFSPVNLNNIASVDVIRGGGAVRYGPQNVGGIINFNTRAIPATAGASGDASVRYNSYGQGGSSTQYSAFVGGTAENGLGMALLYSGMEGSGWRADTNQRLNDVALKLRYELSPTSEIYGKVSYYDVLSRIAGGLTAAQYNADPFQNTRKRDYWAGTRKGFDLGYLNTISEDKEFEIRTYFNQSNRQSVLINSRGTSLSHQPRNYETFAIEPRFTQRFTFGKTTNDVTAGYRYLRERGDDNRFSENAASDALGSVTTFNNATDAHSFYIDDKIAIGKWRITPGVRYEHIRSTRYRASNNARFEVNNNKPLPSINVAYLATGNLTLFANYNTSFGVVQNSQLNNMSAGNPLSPELAKTVEAGTRWKSDQLSLEATLFNIRFDNQINSSTLADGTTIFRNIGKTEHRGIELAADYAFDRAGPLGGWSVFASYAYTRAQQISGANEGKDVPFYSRMTDTVGTRYQHGPLSFNLSTTHQSRQFADPGNTVAESADGGIGEIPGFRLWNAQVAWKVPNAKGFDIFAGVNNLTDRRYFTRTDDGNSGRLVGAPRTLYVQGRYSF